MSIAKQSDSEIKVRIPTQKETYLRFVEETAPTTTKKDGQYLRPSDITQIRHLTEALGFIWNIRICNSAGDFARVNLETPTFNRLRFKL